MVLVAVVVVVAACGSGDTKNGTAAKTTSSSSGGGDIASIVANDPLAGKVGGGLTRGASGDTIRVGCVYTADAYAGADDGYKARFERVNREGGIHGRKIDFSGCQDDGANTQQNLQIARRLVEQDKVFAVMSASANILSGTTDYLGQKEVPYYGWGFTPGFCGDRWGFGFSGCLIGDALKDDVPHAVAQGNLADTGIKASGLLAPQVKVAVQGGDDDAGHAGNSQYHTVYEDRGATVAYDEANMPVPGPPADYSPFVRAVLDAKPNLVIASLNFQSTPGLVAALEAAGYSGTTINAVTYVPGLLARSPQLAKALEGTYVNTQIVPQEEQTDYIKQIETDLTAIKAKNGTFIPIGAAIAYAQAEMLVEQLQAVGRDLNTKTFDEKVNGGDFTFHPKESGGPGKLAFPQGHFLPSDCAALLKIEKAKYVPVVPFDCYKSVRVR
ncbi:ABC transporter substrate-binding protein [Baekduia sp.]|uniref:ABC transporter substrate-binding protein n=1 Tax=Baekduia sp. TaxID=2600305 RepID=UPI002D1FA93E|nr:ABC transporter substrate-binding protein [Baekduia sp.]